MDILIISGLSGAGKSRTAAVLEDIGFYCVDNMPTKIMPVFAEFCIATRGRYEKVALVTDVRAGDNFDDLFAALDEMRSMGCDYKILYIEASTDAIAKRYKETRRRHPLDLEGGNMTESILKERRLLKPVKDRADYIIDTTNLTVSRLQARLDALFSGETNLKRFNVNIVSFGYKYGIPIDADIVFDVRFLRNPYYIAELREKSGLDGDVYDYVMEDPRAVTFVDKTAELLEFLMPNYMEEGKTSLVICVGCTGGKHRSVTIARALGEKIEKMKYPVECVHRDVTK